jgi:hypothetical protein
MKKSDIYEIVIKIVGIYLFFTSIGLLRDLLSAIAAIMQLIQNPDAYGDFDQTPFLILSIAYFVVVILFAALLTLKTKTIVKLVCKPSDYEETSSLFADRKVIYEIALVIMGLLLILWTLPDFAFRMRNYMTLVRSHIQPENYDTNFIGASAIKIVIGLIAVVYAKSISKVLIRDINKGNPE